MFILSINQSAINLPPRDVLPINTRRTSCESKTSLLPCCFPHLFGYAFEVSALFIQFLFRCLVLRCVSLLFLFHYLLLQTRDPRIWESLLNNIHYEYIMPSCWRTWIEFHVDLSNLGHYCALCQIPIVGLGLWTFVI